MGSGVFSSHVLANSRQSHALWTLTLKVGYTGEAYDHTIDGLATTRDRLERSNPFASYFTFCRDPGRRQNRHGATNRHGHEHHDTLRRGNLNRTLTTCLLYSLLGVCRNGTPVFTCPRTIPLISACVAWELARTVLSPAESSFTGP